MRGAKDFQTAFQGVGRELNKPRSATHDAEGLAIEL
jgi:hypothetical protein